MITDEITKAKQAKKKSTVNTILIVVLVIIISALILFGVSNFKLLTQGEADKQQTSAQLEKGDQQSKDKIDAPTPTLGTDEELRQAYLERFTHFENTVRPELQTIDIAKWDKSLSDKLVSQEQQAVKAFGQGQYSSALTALNKLIATAESTLADSRIAFETAMQKASSAYEANDYESAQLAINTALMHNAASESAEQLAKKIDRLPEIAELDDAIKTAKIENDVSKELSLIKQLLAIDPSRTDMQQRAKSLRSQLAESRFKNAINQANRAIDKRQLATAKKALSQAKSIYPSRPEITKMTQEIVELESQVRFESHRAQGDKASKSDNWSMAKQQYKLALLENPTDKRTVDQFALAERIVSTSSDIKSFQLTPFRLSNASVKANAEAALNQAEQLRNKSAKLARAARELKSTIAAANTLIPVTVLSDGLTFVQVRGVGKVGTTASKVIQLKPGDYRFEGKREGYKSKLINATIPLKNASFSITVVADERI